MQNRTLGGKLYQQGDSQHGYGQHEQGKEGTGYVK